MTFIVELFPLSFLDLEGLSYHLFELRLTLVVIVVVLSLESPFHKPALFPASSVLAMPRDCMIVTL